MINQSPEPRSFQISRGQSDHWLLIGILILGGCILVVPALYAWIMRAGLVVVGIVLLQFIISARRFGHERPHSPHGPVGIIIALGVLAFWIAMIVRAFLAAKWLDASLVSVVVIELVYLESLKTWRRRRIAPNPSDSPYA